MLRSFIHSFSKLPYLPAGTYLARNLSMKSKTVRTNSIVPTMVAAAPYDDLPVELRLRYFRHIQTITPTSSSFSSYAFLPLVLGRRSKLFGRSNTNRNTGTNTKLHQVLCPSTAINNIMGEWGGEGDGHGSPGGSGSR